MYGGPTREAMTAKEWNVWDALIQTVEPWEAEQRREAAKAQGR